MHSHFQILLRGYMGLRIKYVGGGPIFLCFIAFLCYNFLKSFEGVHEVPPSPPPPVCIWVRFLVESWIKISFLFPSTKYKVK